MREAIAFALFACACGLTARVPDRPAVSTSTSTLTATPTAIPTSSAAPKATSFPDLVARYSPGLPGMHVIAAHETGGEATEIARAEGADLCVRVAFDASAPVVATLTDSSGSALATSPEGADGLLAAGGPVCVRRGDAVRASASGPPSARIRWVAWSARP